MSGISKVKMLALGVAAVLVVCAASIAFMMPSDSNTNNGGLTPEMPVIAESGEVVQSGSVQYLMKLMDLCYFYIDTADASDYDYIYGDGCANGNTFTVTNRTYYDNILLNDGAIVDFSSCAQLVMNGAILCVNGDVDFVQSDNTEFSIKTENEAKFMLGANIRLAIASTLTATPFKICYEGENNLYDENHNPLSTLTVNGSFSINLHDDVADSHLSLDHNRVSGSLGDMHYEHTVIYYEFFGRDGAEMIVDIDYDFTDYYSFVIEHFPAGTEENPPEVLSVSDWINYFFSDDDYSIPNGSASFFMNGLEMEYEYDTYDYYGTQGTAPLFCHKDGSFDVTKVDQLTISIECYNKTSSTPKNGEILFSAVDVRYTHSYEESVKPIIGSVIGTPTEATERVNVQNFEMDLNVDASSSGTTTVTTDADLIHLEIDYTGETFDRTVFVTIKELESSAKFNKNDIAYLYQFLVNLLNSEDVIDVLMSADYNVLLCDAVIKLKCKELSADYSYAEHALDSMGTMGYTPYNSSGTIFADTIKFNCNYYGSSDYSEVSIKTLTVDHDDHTRSMAQISSGKYVPSKTDTSTDVNVSSFSLDANLKLTDLNTIIEYLVNVVLGEDVSDILLKGISVNANLTKFKMVSTEELKYAATNEYDTNLWDRDINNDVYFAKTISNSKTEVNVENFSMDEDIKNVGSEEAYVNVDKITLSTVIAQPDNGIDTTTTLEAGVNDFSASVDSEVPKLLIMTLALAKCMSSDDVATGLESFLVNYIFDGTDIDVSASLDNVYMNYDVAVVSTVVQGTETVKTTLMSDKLDMMMGTETPAIGDGKKAMTLALTLNAGNNTSGVGYHDSLFAVSMTDDARVSYLLEDKYIDSNYPDGVTEVQSLETYVNEYILEGMNCTVSIDSIISVDAVIDYEAIRTETSSEPLSGGTNGNSVNVEIEINDSTLDMEAKYDKMVNILNFIQTIRASQDPLSIASTQEYDELFNGLYIHSVNGEQKYNVITEMTGPSHLKETQSYHTDGYEVYVDYLNNHYFSIETSHICSDSTSSYYNRSATDESSTSINLYDLYVKVDTELAGLNDFMIYAMTFLSTGNLDTEVTENFNVSVEIDVSGIEGKDEYVMAHTITPESGSSVESYDESRMLNFTKVSIDLIVGTSGTEQIVIVANDFSFTHVKEEGSSTMNTVLDIDYVETSLGTDTKGLYKLISVMYSQFGDPQVSTSSNQILSAVLSFISDDSNTRFYFRLSSGELSVTMQDGVTDSVYKITVPKSKTDKFAFTAEGALKISCDDDMNFKINDSFIRINTAQDSKVAYTDSYGGNEYIEYYEFENLDASIKISSSIDFTSLTKYLGNQEQMIAYIMDSIIIKGVISADSGKYTSSRIHETNSYRIQIRSDDPLMIKANTTLYKLYSLESSTQSVTMEGTNGNIVSEYTGSDNVTIKEIFDFDSFKAYIAKGTFYVDAPSMSAEVVIGNESYGMQTDGTVYFNYEMPSLGGYSIYKNGVLYESEGYGVAPVVTVDTFTVTGDSVQYAGMTFVKGTEIELKEQPNAPSNFAGWKINNVMVPRSLSGGSVYYSPMEDSITISYVYGYILTYETKGGSNVDQVTLNVGDVIDLSAVPVKEGCTFVKWDSAYSVMPAFNLTVTAVWNPNSYVLTVDYDNGTQNKESSVVYGDTISMTYTPTRDGYTFAGWLGYTDKMLMPASDLTIKALWSKKVTESSVSMDQNGAKVDIGADIAEMSKEVLDKIINMANDSKSDLEMSFSGATISMSTDALKRLANDEITGKSSDIKMSVTKSFAVDESILKTVDSKNQDILKNSKYAISIDVSSNGCTTGLGKVTVAVPVDDVYLGSVFVVYYVSTEGDVTLINAECEKVNGQTCVVFETDHFSYFALNEIGTKAADSDGSSGMSYLIYVAIGASCLLVIGIIVFVVLKRKYII